MPDELAEAIKGIRNLKVHGTRLITVMIPPSSGALLAWPGGKLVRWQAPTMSGSAALAPLPVGQARSRPWRAPPAWSGAVVSP